MWHAPGKYLERIITRRGISKEQLSEVLEGHIVTPDIIFNDDFMAFYEDRKEKILQRIEKATNKFIPRENQITDEEVYDNSFQEEVEMNNEPKLF